MNDTERDQWVDNDEPMYRWWRSTGLSKTRFLREHRAEIDQAIADVQRRSIETRR